MFLSIVLAEASFQVLQYTNFDKKSLVLNRVG